MPEGVTIALVGDTGAGKTTQSGEYALEKFRVDRRRTWLFKSDKGSVASIQHLVDLGIVEVHELAPEMNAWLWVNAKADGKLYDGSTFPDDVGLVINDSGTSDSEALIQACAKQAAEGMEVGGRPAPKFNVKTSAGETLKIGSNVDSHYFVVQTFMTDALWRSSWLTKRGVDVIWTFSVHRGESAAGENAIVGPKLAGKALTPAIPKWFTYTFRLVSNPITGQPAEHILYLQEQPDSQGLAVSMSNPRYPLGATTPLPAILSPASLVEAVRLIRQGQEEAKENVKLELGL